MPAKRTNVSFEPRTLELLYNKYVKAGTKITSISSTPFTPSPALVHNSAAAWYSLSAKGGGEVGVGGVTGGHAKRMRIGRSHPPPRVTASQAELGDLRELGQKLSKVGCVQMLLDLPGDHRKGHCNTHQHGGTNGKDGGKEKCRSQTGSAPSINGRPTCQLCQEENQREEEQTKMKNLKSKLKMVAKASRSLPDCPKDRSNTVNGCITTPLRRSSQQRVVPLPMLQTAWQRNVTNSEDLTALRETHKTTTYKPYHQHSAHRKTGLVPVRGLGNWIGGDGGGGQRQSHSLERHNPHPNVDSSDASSLFYAPQQVPGCSPIGYIDENVNKNKDGNGIDDTSSYDSDRVDRQQFEYVFNQHSNDSYTSSEESDDDSGTIESDTASFSARAQRPSTTDTICTKRLVETRASMRHRAIESPADSPRQKTRGSTAAGAGESWPSQNSIVPNSWPAEDDPYRFQYIGRGVVRDIIRRRHHKSRGRCRGRGNSDLEHPQPVSMQRQKLEVVVPSAQCDCNLCGKTGNCEHSPPQSGTHSCCLQCGFFFTSSPPL